MCQYPVWKIICTIQDPDDKTVFGYECFMYPTTLNAFKSEEVSETKEAL